MKLINAEPHKHKFTKPTKLRVELENHNNDKSPIAGHDIIKQLMCAEIVADHKCGATRAIDLERSKT